MRLSADSLWTRADQVLGCYSRALSGVGNVQRASGPSPFGLVRVAEETFHRAEWNFPLRARLSEPTPSVERAGLRSAGSGTDRQKEEGRQIVLAG